uniref:BolA-like protein n=1 Tax=Chromera velia CCMP2878 TaxID=1169474 RepID=A0A0G4FVB4_9ALVE|eukprot:Cvel_3794.t1-p1 / transcript=Cvel_3794.t1 / gene=Cvel_3794 / organism=Chromera_velia_CCMP2878 / gene_product=Uncharacterized bolA-like protein C8C9.11, putative / transcript_product=Uncharacterized bolA-like protein C8C9.11, putative / location=Cvel_scaffold159:90927-91898(-) / protein_length=85 / sequence_SO=supercontig / SO=protein_coding / is_pseudo=false
MASTEQVQTKLTEALKPSVLKVIDQSGGCGAAFHAIVVSEAFEGQRLLQRQRMVNDAIKAEMAEIHAFTMKCYTPAEFEKAQADS